MLKTAAPYAAIFILAFVARAGHLGKDLSSGRTETERAARSLANGGTLGNVFAEDSGPSAHLAPLFPWLLGQLYRLTDWIGASPCLYQQALATLMTCLGICGIPYLARRAQLQPGAGWLAAVLLGVLPGNRFFEISGCHEQSLLFPWLTLVLLVFIRLREVRWRSPLWVSAAAVFVGVSALLNPVFLAIVALVVLCHFLTLRDDRRAVLTGALVVAAATAILLLPWAYRNHRELGGWVWTRSNFGLELAIGNNPDATGQTYFPRFAEMHPFGSQVECAEYKRAGELAYMRAKQKAARDWIAANPADFLTLCAWRAGWFWFPVKSMVWWDGKKWVAHLASASTLGTIACLLWLFRIAHPHRWLFLIALLGFSLPYLVTHVEGRYRYPLHGLCILLSSDVAIRAAKRGRESFFNPRRAMAGRETGASIPAPGPWRSTASTDHSRTDNSASRCDEVPSVPSRLAAD